MNGTFVFYFPLFSGHTIPKRGDGMVIDQMGRAILRGRWRSAAVAQTVQLLAVLVGTAMGWAAFSLFGTAGLGVCAVLTVALDVIVISPLKWGCAAFYWRSIYQSDTTLLSCLTDAYRRRFHAAVSWRVGIWLRGIGAVTVCGLPWAVGRAVLSTLRGTAPLIGATTVFLQGITAFLAVAGVVACAVWMLGYVPALYLMIAGADAGEAFAWSRKLMKGTYNQTAWYFGGFVWWLPLYAVAYPWVSALFESGKAGLVYRRLRDFRRGTAKQKPDVTA